jgi:hypothetical protein
MTLLLDQPTVFRGDRLSVIRQFFPEKTKVVYAGEPIPEDTHYVIAKAHKDLDTERGFVFPFNGGLAVRSYNPQDALIPWKKDTKPPEETGKDYGRTDPKNYKFWLEEDIKKLLNPPSSSKEVPMIIPIDVAISLLREGRGTLTLDIETHPPTNSVQCIGFCFNKEQVYVVGCYDHTGERCGNLARFFAALALAMARCRTVAHNTMFDLGFLYQFHNVPFGRDLADTMIMHHRHWPEAEKSLGHCISLWLNEKFHKDSAGSFTPSTYKAFYQLMMYNGYDVIRTRDLYYAIPHNHSTERANATIYPYLLAGIVGLPYDQLALSKRRKPYDEATAQYARIGKILCGKPINMGSPQQVKLYLGAIGIETDSTEESELYKLKLKHDNAFLTVLLRYREAAKAASMLRFKQYHKPARR